MFGKKDDFKDHQKKQKNNKEEDKKRKEQEEQQRREMWAIIMVLVAVFIFVGNQIPNATGFIGHWLIEVYARKLVGDSVLYLPFFLFMPAISLMYSKVTWQSLLSTTTFFFVTFTIFLDLLQGEVVDTLTWPLKQQGGGWIGTVGLFALDKTVGYSGTWIFLTGAFVVSGVLLFNLSLKEVSLHVWSGFSQKQYEKKNKKEESEKPKKSAQTSLLNRIVSLLFFSTKTKRVASENSVFDSIREPLDVLAIQKQTIPPPDFSEPAPASAPAPEPEDKEPNVFKPKIRLKKEFEKPKSPFQLPAMALLEKADQKLGRITKGTIREQQEKSAILEEALTSFNVAAKVVHVSTGPSVTRFELQPGDGVKISKITALSKDIALKLAAPDIRIEAPIPGKALVGIEVPNPTIETVSIRTIIEKTEFFQMPSKLVSAMGLTITGEPILMDLAKMPHVLIAGATGSGKSVCVNAIILSILLRATPDDVRMLMIDPKKVELSMYEGIPHLLAPVVTNPHKAAATLKKWAISEMERRYEEFSKVGVRNIEGYNARVLEIEKLNVTNQALARKKAEAMMPELTVEGEAFFVPPKLPYIVVVIDELADLMMVASQEVENTICRLAQMSRATGIHLVIATQRPSVNVVTGLIKANIPSRISFYLQSQIDSRTILDMGGAEKLLGKGDMLYAPVGYFKPKRLQGVFVSDREVKQIVSFWKKQGGPQYLSEIVDIEPISSESGADDKTDQSDDLFEEAKNIVMSTQYASTSYLQRKLRIGYNRAARIMDELEAQGIISEYAGERKPRSVGS